MVLEGGTCSVTRGDTCSCIRGDTRGCTRGGTRGGTRGNIMCCILKYIIVKYQDDPKNVS